MGVTGPALPSRQPPPEGPGNGQIAGQIAHNFDEEDGWMISVPLQGDMKFSIQASRKGII